MAHAAVGLAAAAHPELDDPAARLRLPRYRPGRLPQRTGGHGDARGLRGCIRGAGTDRHDGDLGQGRRRRVPRADRPGNLARADGGAGLRGGHSAGGAGAGAAGAGRDHLGHPGGLPQPGRAAPRRRAGGRRLGQRDPARRRAAPLRAPGHARRRRARPHATHLPRPGHPVVAGVLGGAGPALRRGRRSGAGAERAVHAAGRLARPDGRPERTELGRGAARRPPGRDPGRGRPSSLAPWPTCARWPT